VLSVRSLSVTFATEGLPVRPVDDISMDIQPGETLAVVGESGSGKSTLALALMGLLRTHGTVVAGSVRLLDRELTQMSEAQRRDVRGSQLAMIFQDPATSLNPVTRVGPQLVEAIRVHNHDISRADARQKVTDFLASVGLPDPVATFSAYPHQLSGGMKQRAMIAMAMINHPKLLIADEPTTALDVTVQAQVLQVLKRMQAASETSVLFITHNLDIVTDLADRVAVMYAGQIIEQGRVASVFARPQHPYTQALLASVPRIDRAQTLTAALPGSAVGAANRPSGCRFHPRCAFATDVCSVEAPLLRPLGEDGSAVACHHAETIAQSSEPAEISVPPVIRAAEADADTSPVLTVRDLSYSHATRWRMRRGRAHDRAAVDNVSLDLLPGQTLGLVGESGSGKTTLARSIARLIEPGTGSIKLGDLELVGASKRELALARRRIQFVFQDPYESLDPLWTVGDLVREPLRQFKLTRAAEIAAARDALHSVDLAEADWHRKPRDFSGGERQRISLARALVVKPDVLILDEPSASLDVSVQAKIIELLQSIQRDHRIAFLFITHDLALVRQVAARIAVMFGGQIVEQGAVEQIFTRPVHPYTARLLASVPGCSSDPVIGGEGLRQLPMRDAV
jgi:peptide/nickel transport system ATP-binding protein